MIERCADMHLIGVLHNDIKPQNFVMGFGAHADLMYVVDFGLADRLEYDPVAMSHILQSSGCGDVKGTKAFQSMRAHQGKVAQTDSTVCRSLSATVRRWLRCRRFTPQLRCMRTQCCL